MNDQQRAAKVFAKRLYAWHREHPRPMPWKETRDPYRIWVSEVILQQTRVEQGWPYYLAFTEHFPTVYALADATEDELMAVWKGLGYYSRARNMHRAAKMIVSRFEGQFPSDHDTILSLPGIGAYTAAAISSFAFDGPYPVIDGNVKRVIARYAGIMQPIDSRDGAESIAQTIHKLFDPGAAAVFNQAIMDFGATQCTPRKPDCSECPLASTCKAFQMQQVDLIPIKEKKLKRKRRYFHYFVVTIDGKLVLRKREEKDVWQGLYEPLLYEEETDGIISGDRQLEFLEQHVRLIEASPAVSISSRRQLLSHQEIFARFYFFPLSGDQVALKKEAELVNPQNLSNFALPKVVDWYLSEFSIT